MGVVSEIEQSERALRCAMLAGDVHALESLLAEAMVFTDQNGNRLSRTDDLAAHASGILKIDRLDVRGEPLILPLGDSAVVCVTVELAGRYDGQPFGGAFAYSRVWHRHGDRWQVEAAHCSAVAGD